MPVQVITEVGAAIVAQEHAVRVQHGHNLEHKLGAKPFGLLRVAHQQVNDTLAKVVKRMARHKSMSCTRSRTLRPLRYEVTSTVPDTRIVQVSPQDALVP